MNQLKGYVDSVHSNPHDSTERPAARDASLKIDLQKPDGKNVPLKGITHEVPVYDTTLDDEIADVMKDLPNQFRVVEPTDKLAVTWRA